MDEEYRRLIEIMKNTSRGPYGATYNEVEARPSYSLAEVQLTGGRMIGMTITASVSLATHLTKSMRETGYLTLFNDSESLLIRAEEVVAVKLTKLTIGG